MNKYLVTTILLLFTATLSAQSSRSSILYQRIIKNSGDLFESMTLGGEQTAITPSHKILYGDINVRTGSFASSNSIAEGALGSLNTRLGLMYSPTRNLVAGIGYTTDSSIIDLSLKYSFFQAGGPYNKPLSLTAYANVAYSGKPAQADANDRISSFLQIIFAGKITSQFSVQAAVSLSYFSAPRSLINDKDEVLAKMEKTHLTGSILARYKMGERIRLFGTLSQPITKHFIFNPSPNIGLGLEYNIPTYTLQLFISNYNMIVPQYNNMFNENDYKTGDFIVGVTVGKFFFL